MIPDPRNFASLETWAKALYEALRPKAPEPPPTALTVPAHPVSDLPKASRDLMVIGILDPVDANALALSLGGNWYRIALEP